MELGELKTSTPPSVKLGPTLHLWKLQQDLGNGPASKSPAPGKFGIRCAALGCVILAQNSSFPQAVRKLGKGKVKKDFWSSSSIFALFLAMHLTQASEIIFRFKCIFPFQKNNLNSNLDNSSFPPGTGHRCLLTQIYTWTQSDPGCKLWQYQNPPGLTSMLVHVMTWWWWWRCLGAPEVKRRKPLRVEATSAWSVHSIRHLVFVIWAKPLCEKTVEFPVAENVFYLGHIWGMWGISEACVGHHLGHVWGIILRHVWGSLIYQRCYMHL